MKMITLMHDDGLYQCFAGAGTFEDGTDPFFAPIQLTHDLVEDSQNFGKDGILILDHSETGFMTLSVNFMTEDCYALVFEKIFTDMTWAEAKDLVEENLSEEMSFNNLMAFGFLETS